MSSDEDGTLEKWVADFRQQWEKHLADRDISVPTVGDTIYLAIHEGGDPFAEKLRARLIPIDDHYRVIQRQQRQILRDFKNASRIADEQQAPLPDPACICEQHLIVYPGTMIEVLLVYWQHQAARFPGSAEWDYMRSPPGWPHDVVIRAGKRWGCNRRSEEDITFTRRQFLEYVGFGNVNWSLVDQYDQLWRCYKKDPSQLRLDLVSFMREHQPHPQTIIFLLKVEFYHLEHSAPGSTEADYFIVPAPLQIQYPEEVSRAIADFRRERGVTLEPGALFAGLTVEKHLKTGGMGSIYQAEHSVLGKVALKVLRVDKLQSLTQTRGERLKEHLFNEGRILRMLSQGNATFPQCHDAGTFCGVHYIVEELIEGRTFWELAKDETLSIEDIARIGADVADGLYVARSKGIAHCDISPSNLMLTSDGAIKIIDFGVSKHESTDAQVIDVFTGATLSVQTSVFGTKGFIAPEVEAGAPYSESAEIYSLASSLFLVLTDKTWESFQRQCDIVTSAPIAARLIEAAIRKAASSRRVAPDAAHVKLLEHILATNLSDSPENRYATLGDFAGALRRCNSRDYVTLKLPPIHYEAQRVPSVEPEGCLGIFTLAPIQAFLALLLGLYTAFENGIDKEAFTPMWMSAFRQTLFGGFFMIGYLPITFLVCFGLQSYLRAWRYNEDRAFQILCGTASILTVAVMGGVATCDLIGCADVIHAPIGSLRVVGMNLWVGTMLAGLGWLFLAIVGVVEM
ncbi:MAG: serine/threonine protein kinase [Planctomycetes bacterium]|nr:serine/threonine protein kinase [Planctomycetota bacterium]